MLVRQGVGGTNPIGGDAGSKTGGGVASGNTLRYQSAVCAVRVSPGTAPS